MPPPLRNVFVDGKSSKTLRFRVSLSVQMAPSPTPFARYFALRDAERTDFRLITSRDDDLKRYVDLDGVIPQLQAQLRDTAPRLIVEGDFGTGKSHVLRYVERFLSAPRFEPVYVTLSGFHRRSDFLQFHHQLSAQLLPLARRALEKSGDKRARIDALTGITENMKIAFETLAISDPNNARPGTVNAEQWLSASTALTSARMAKSGFTRLLVEEAGPDRLVAMYKAISDLHFDAFGTRILLLLDEAESFTRIVDSDAQASIGAGMRALFDNENQSLGFFIGLNTPQARSGVHPMLRSDVRSRIGTRRVQLPPLTADRVKQFVTSLWSNFTTKRELPPFQLSGPALQLISTKLDLFCEAFSADWAVATPGPRDLLHLLSLIGDAAISQNIPAPISSKTLTSWFGIQAG